MDEIETEFSKTQEKTPVAWFRYIDDIFFIWNHGKEHLEIFLEKLINFNRDLKFTYESNEKEIPFLDLNVKLKENKISINLYFKSMERYQYLPFTSSNPYQYLPFTSCNPYQYVPFTSSNPNHTKRSILYSQGSRVKTTCSEKEDFLKSTSPGTREG